MDTSVPDRGVYVERIKPTDTGVLAAWQKKTASGWRN
jgi:hypothetical protein